jgi:hypothetical protein
MAERGRFQVDLGVYIAVYGTKDQRILSESQELGTALNDAVVVVSILTPRSQPVNQRLDAGTGGAAADTLFFSKRPPPPSAPLHLSYITAPSPRADFLLASNNCSKTEKLHLDQTIGNAKLKTPSLPYHSIHTALNRTTFTTKNHLHPELYMYSRHGQRSRYGPPLKLDTFRALRRPDTNHHSANG